MARPRGRRPVSLAGALLAGALAACAGARLTPAQQELARRGDCAALLREADQARAHGLSGVAAALARACPQAGLSQLVREASSPVEALLWCGRARAAIGRRGEAPACDVKVVTQLREALKPKLTIGPPDESQAPDPRLEAALQEVRGELNLLWDPDPDVIVGRLELEIEQQDSAALAPVTDKDGKRRKVPGTAHRMVARCTAEVALGGRTRTLRASAEARDVTWAAVPRLGVAGKAEPLLPAEAALQQQAAVAFLRVLAKALAVSPPETVDLDDARGCVAYGLALNATSGDPEAAAKGLGEEERVRRCEGLLGVPEGAGIPVP